MKFEWESIDNFHKRVKVFGGWLVKAYQHVEHSNYSDLYSTWQREQSQEMNISMTFVPDAKYEWVLDGE